MADRTVSTVEEIEALPDDAVLRDGRGYVWQHRCDPDDVECRWSGTLGAAWIAEEIITSGPLTVLVAEQTPPAHMHDWRLAERISQSVVRERCYDCGAQQIRDPQL